jgi:EpsD family peptidyl-prolyl cis-trans isomerase
MARKLILPFALVIGLAAAISMVDRDAGRGDGSVAAVVNGEKIRAHQLEAMLAQTGAAPSEDKRAQAAALDRLIDQELLAQQARKAGLERDPRVVQALEAAQRQILGQAWLERAAADGKENRAEVERFYRDNPALFRNRRVYRVLEISAAVPQEMQVEIRKAAAGAGNLHEIATWLESRKVPFNVATATRPAEQIPLHVLPRVAGMSNGQIAVFPTPKGVSIVQLLRSNELPMTESEAAPVIERYLVNKKRVDIAATEVRRLRGQAAIEYLGDYQALRAETTPPPAPRRAREAIAVMPGMPQANAATH